MKTPKKTISLLLATAIILQTLVYIKVGIDKSYIHMDEAYSLGLASYDKVEIQDNEDFYNTWHGGEYYEDYLALNTDEMDDFSPVYENQKNDVHPPLYYLLLRIAMIFSPDHFSKWGGIVINIIIYAFITIFAYLIIKKLLGDKYKDKKFAIILAFASSITLASLTNVIYIRMYALAALNILIITYLHMKLYEEYKKSTLVLIGLSALIGSLTHYFFLFYLAMLFVIMLVHFIRKKENKHLLWYVITLAIAAMASLAIFPYSIQHMFFGYRGDGVISKLTDFSNIPNIVSGIFQYLGIIHFFAFNNILIIILAILIVVAIYRKTKNVRKGIKFDSCFKLIWAPTAFYTLLVAVSSPWIELRYIAPVCTLIFIIMFYLMWKIFGSITTDKVVALTTYILLAIMLVLPIVIRAEPQVEYSDKKEIVEQLGGEMNVPTVFWFNSNENRFLDDILLFSILNESYVAKDAELTNENINDILADRDISKGVVLFINGGQNNDEIINAMLDATRLESATHIKRMNACDIYYLK